MRSEAVVGDKSKCAMLSFCSSCSSVRNQELGSSLIRDVANETSNAPQEASRWVRRGPNFETVLQAYMRAKTTGLGNTLFN